MKQLKMLIIAAVTAMSLTAFAGAGTAPATVLCTTETNPCTFDYASGTQINVSLVGSGVLESGSSTILTCTETPTTMQTTSTGGSSATVTANVTSLTQRCSATVDTIKLGQGEVHNIAGTANGTVTSEGTEVTLAIFGVTCTYTNPKDLGVLTAGENPRIVVKANIKKTAGGFLCPSEPTWTAEYAVTEPHAIYVEPS